MYIAVVAVIERGERQAAALGFVLWMAVYVSLLFLQPDTRRFPTEKLLTPVFESVVTRTWVDDRTGAVIPDYDPEKPSRLVSEKTDPEHRWFMNIGHVLWALLLGYIGSRIATWICARRIAIRTDAQNRTSQADVN
ncbi:MAG TPA: hypothetical protein VFV87_19345 [Pirellulaceae bacterium]|nr:hypothetical protein [Pirellulaceae bacterium]